MATQQGGSPAGREGPHRCLSKGRQRMASRAVHEGWLTTTAAVAPRDRMCYVSTSHEPWNGADHDDIKTKFGQRGVLDGRRSCGVHLSRIGEQRAGRCPAASLVNFACSSPGADSVTVQPRMSTGVRLTLLGRGGAIEVDRRWRRRLGG